MNPGAEFNARARVALGSLSPELREAVERAVNQFFEKYPEVERTELTAGYVASLAIETLSNPADSQSAPTQTAKVA